MARADIVAGLKNAVERGYTLEQAKSSFISAGYNQREVEEASSFVDSGFVAQKSQVLPSPSVLPSKSKTSWAKINWKIILLFGVLFALIALLILTLIFRNKLINLLS